MVVSHHQFAPTTNIRCITQSRKLHKCTHTICIMYMKNACSCPIPDYQVMKCLAGKSTVHLQPLSPGKHAMQTEISFYKAISK